MKKSRFSEADIVAILQENERGCAAGGGHASHGCREHLGEESVPVHRLRSVGPTLSHHASSAR